MEKVSVLLFRHGNALQHQHNSPARSTDVDRLIRGVKHQHRRVQGMSIAFLMKAEDGGSDGTPNPIGPRIVPVS